MTMASSVDRKILGCSRLGIVYGAISNGNRVAVKKVLIDYFEDFRDASSLRRLEHENVVQILKVGDVTEGGSVYRLFMLELCSGTLDHYFVGHFDHVPSEKIPNDVDAMFQMSSGLQFLHSKDVSHGAVKPGNVLIWMPPVIECQAVFKISQDSMMTWTKGDFPQQIISFNSVSFWPPEFVQLLEMDDCVTPSASGDVFSLGCVSYSYITKGKHLFGRSPHILPNILKGENQLSCIANSLTVGVIRKMISPDANLRPTSNEVVETLTKLQTKAVTKTPRSVSISTLDPNEHLRYIAEYRVNRCPDFHSEVGCAFNFCFDYHYPNQRRRQSIIRKDGTLNYSNSQYCPQYNKETGKCPKGDNCALLHENMGNTERRFHLSNFKTEMCNQKSCSHPHCSFAHSDADMRTPVFGKGDPRVRNDEHGNPPAPNLTMNDKVNQWPNPEYVMNHYKTQPCSSTYDQCSQKFYCFNYHNSQDKRRSLKTFTYWSHPCPHLIDEASNDWRDPSACRDGDACRYCHNQREYQYHALNYKTTDCANLKSGTCKRGQLCAFAHEGDKRKPKQFEEDRVSLDDLKSYLSLV